MNLAQTGLPLLPRMNPETASGSETLTLLSVVCQMHSDDKRLWECSYSSVREHSANLCGLCLICEVSLLGNRWTLKGLAELLGYLLFDIPPQIIMKSRKNFTVKLKVILLTEMQTLLSDLLGKIRSEIIAYS